MTTKDQAIAWYLQTPKKTRVTQINMDGADGWMPLFPRPVPDCRTCSQRYISNGRDACVPHCTNGDKYKPAPAVVLWRTE